MKEERLCVDEPSLLKKSFSALPSSSPHSPADLFHKLSVTLTSTKSCNNSKYNVTKDGLLFFVSMFSFYACFTSPNKTSITIVMLHFPEICIMFVLSAQFLNCTFKLSTSWPAAPVLSVFNKIK
jgi:hypothetical protein